MLVEFSKLEKKIIKFWKENRIFEKSIEQRKKAPNFVFYEGPPTANGKPGIHHLEARVFKDMICRYKTMNGFKVIRKSGWDTHGLPVELEVEKKLGLRSKKDIEKFGIIKFNQKCQESVWQYKKDWEDLTEKIGYWLDMKNPYITYETDYIETVWWLLKQIWQKKLLYKDYKVVPYCPRCGTSLSSHEVAQGYKKVKENSIYVKFSIKGQKNTYLLVWTTTPWTLPGNAAVAVNPKFIYAKVKVNNEFLILAKNRIKESGIEGEVIEEFKGKDLIGLKYKPLYKFQIPNIYKIVAGDFVTTEDGTGLVHIAPAFGEDDMNVSKENNLPVLITVDEQGKMMTSGYKWNNLFVKKADPLIIEDLKKRKLLFKEELYEHDYPFCWRCKTPLIYYAQKSWFIKMTKVKRDLIKNNEKINWVPKHLKQGRFGEWLRGLKDWAISRERYWGTPLPIWQCKKCGYQEIIGSKDDLLKQKFSTNKYFILRHGESECFKKHILSYKNKGAGCPLTKKGREQIKKAVQELKKEKIDLIFSSDFLRTKQTAEIISKEIGKKVKYDKRLIEVNIGIFDGKNIKEYRKLFEGKIDKFDKRPFKGESYTDVKKRVYDFLKEVDKKYKNKNILIVSHGGPILMAESIVKGFSQQEITQHWQDRSMDVGELRRLEFKLFPYNKENQELDFHKPYIDEVKFECPKCNNLMKRVPEVIDCWFDSGAMPFAQYHYPFEQEKFKNQFPADYICEAIDQTRGWFYTMLAISTLLDFGTPYKNVISLGHVLDEKGEKMSKSKGNVVDPWHIIEKYGSDAARWYFYTINQPGDSKLFTEKDVDKALKKFILTYYNVYTFFETYVPKENSKLKIQSAKPQRKAQNLLDRWIISRLNELISGVSEKIDNYDITSAARDIEDFVINDLSLWYVRRSRKRFQNPKTKKDFQEASQTLGFVLLSLAKLTAPFVPFISEEICQNSSKNKSVHLEDWPKPDKKAIDKKLEEKMKIVREIVAKGLAQRAKAGIKVRQPLALLEVKSKNEKLKRNKELLGLIKDEVNVKKITFDKTFKLDTKITPKLREEGIIREIIRNIQEMRKKAGYKPKHRVFVRYSGEEKLCEILKKNKKTILKEIVVKDLLEGDRPKRVFDIEKTFKIEGQELWLGIRRI
ncbi:class I tRNA ligase family protein [Candidatus Parcubacteria bacterium]|nr:class I tRNA ligase family protein [Candidatus Parcubacteria bacterium]